MSRNKKLLVALLVLAIIATTGLSAQAASGNTDAKVFCIDVGMATGFGLLNSSPLVGRNFGFNLTVADNFAIGIASTIVNDSTATRSYKLLRLGYYMTPALGFNIYVGGQGTALATGAGAFYNIMKSKSDTAFANALKLKLEYLFDTTNGVASGDIVVALVTSVGY